MVRDSALVRDAQERQGPLDYKRSGLDPKPRTLSRVVLNNSPSPLNEAAVQVLVQEPGF